MLFHEIYGSYYQTVSLILQEAVRGTLTKKSLSGLIKKHAFGESSLNIPSGLTGEQWRLLHQDLTTPLTDEPKMPLTILEKRWLKALLLDPRVRLFAPDSAGFDEIAPLFTPDMFVYYDRYTDGDDYQDETYARNFRNIVTAIREKKNLLLEYESRDGSRNKMTVTPQYLEYSEKDDRFRLFARGKYRHWILNLSRIKECSLEAAEKRMPGRAPAEQALRFELTDHRNAMERVLLHFSHLRKETKRLDEKHYQVTLYYDRQDETEMVIRLLSFGPVIRVTEPERIVQQLRERIERQGKLADAPGSGE
ncbi:MAG: WYL domain-containing protein [Oscillospiraceae bacterium]|nr:WYL domain-containing protein [Oscillospiraceae bacterium]